MRWRGLKHEVKRDTKCKVKIKCPLDQFGKMDTLDLCDKMEALEG